VTSSPSCLISSLSSCPLCSEDLLKKMQRHTIVPLMTSEDSPEITEQIVQSILDQVMTCIADSEQTHQSFLLGPFVSSPFVLSSCLLEFRSHLEIIPSPSFGMFLPPHLSLFLSHSLQLILADHAEQYSLSYKGCSAVNPGSFASDFSFVVYRPATQEIEFSKVSV
jgi:hypothetical protein